jgi:hypothetical protein
MSYHSELRDLRSEGIHFKNEKEYYDATNKGSIFWIRT